MRKITIGIGKNFITYLVYLIVSYTITLVSLIVLAFLVFKLKMDDKMVDLAIAGIYVISTLLTGILARKMKDGRFLPWILAISVGYFGILCMISVMLGHKILPNSIGFITTFIICILSGITGGIIAKGR